MGPRRGTTPPKETRPKSAPPPPRRWTFSFRFWREIDHFGLGQEEGKWFGALLRKLHELSRYEIDGFLVDGATRSQWRYHPIDWNADGIPIQRDTCNWIDSDYLDNEADYPFFQFQISTSLGRVVGFWDEEQIFNIVLLDPLHNLQPAKLHNYTVRPTKPLGCEYSALLTLVDSLRRELICEKNPCDARAVFAELAQPRPQSRVLVVGVDEGDMGSIRAVLAEQPGKSLSDILKAGLASLTEHQAEPDLS